MILSERPPPLGLAHFTVIEVPPLELMDLAARVGFARIGLRLHPAFPGAPSYEIPRGSEAMREMKHRLDDTRIEVFDIGFVTIDPSFIAGSPTSIPKRRRPSVLAVATISGVPR